MTNTENAKKADTAYTLAGVSGTIGFFLWALDEPVEHKAALEQFDRLSKEIIDLIQEGKSNQTNIDKMWQLKNSPENFHLVKFKANGEIETIASNSSAEYTTILDKLTAKQSEIERKKKFKLTKLINSTEILSSDRAIEIIDNFTLEENNIEERLNKVKTLIANKTPGTSTSVKATFIATVVFILTGVGLDMVD